MLWYFQYLHLVLRINRLHDRSFVFEKNEGSGGRCPTYKKIASNLGCIKVCPRMEIVLCICKPFGVETWRSRFAEATRPALLLLSLSTNTEEKMKCSYYGKLSGCKEKTLKVAIIHPLECQISLQFKTKVAHNKFSPSKRFSHKKHSVKLVFFSSPLELCSSRSYD